MLHFLSSLISVIAHMHCEVLAIMAPHIPTLVIMLALMCFVVARIMRIGAR